MPATFDLSGYAGFQCVTCLEREIEAENLRLVGERADWIVKNPTEDVANYESLFAVDRSDRAKLAMLEPFMKPETLERRENGGKITLSCLTCGGVLITFHKTGRRARGRT